MIFSIAQIIAYCSRLMMLEPGDIITTRTPPGVGLGQKPAPWYLKAGDIARLGIDGLGEQQQLCVLLEAFEALASPEWRGIGQLTGGA